ncbi:hypothetical protein CDIK_2459 [Cucumispora dikerogammari]|nr:hypothetical protein CDIK_2459 [Cucumispora dikerogammari]
MFTQINIVKIFCQPEEKVVINRPTLYMPIINDNQTNSISTHISTSLFNTQNYEHVALEFEFDLLGFISTDPVEITVKVCVFCEPFSSNIMRKFFLKYSSTVSSTVSPTVSSKIKLSNFIWGISDITSPSPIIEEKTRRFRVYIRSSDTIKVATEKTIEEEIHKLNNVFGTGSKSIEENNIWFEVYVRKLTRPKQAVPLQFISPKYRFLREKKGNIIRLVEHTGVLSTSALES